MGWSRTQVETVSLEDHELPAAGHGAEDADAIAAFFGDGAEELIDEWEPASPMRCVPGRQRTHDREPAPAPPSSASAVAVVPRELAELPPEDPAEPRAFLLHQAANREPATPTPMERTRRGLSYREMVALRAALLERLDPRCHQRMYAAVRRWRQHRDVETLLGRIMPTTDGALLTLVRRDADTFVLCCTDKVTGTGERVLLRRCAEW